MDWNIPIGCLHKGPSAEMEHHADDLVDCDVVERKLVGVNPIIYTCTTRGGEIHLQRPLPRLTGFGNNAKATYMQIGKGRRTERACNPTSGNLMGEVVVNDYGLLVG